MSHARDPDTPADADSLAIKAAATINTSGRMKAPCSMGTQYEYSHAETNAANSCTRIEPRA